MEVKKRASSAVKFAQDTKSDQTAVIFSLNKEAVMLQIQLKEFIIKQLKNFRAVQEEQQRNQWF